MSGPVLVSIIGDVNTYGIGERMEVNGAIGIMRIDFPLVDDEAVFDIFLGRKVSGKTILCPGKNSSTTKTCARSEPITPKCR
jgi:2-phospho-L-lactate guanylyltransferase (CobY/MobA/RfbA family)